MSEFRPEPPASMPPGQPEPEQPRPSEGSLAAGVGLAWLVMVLGSVLLVGSRAFAATLLLPVGILIWGVVALNGSKPRTGKGILLGLASIVAVILLLVAACFGMMSHATFD